MSSRRNEKTISISLIKKGLDCLELWLRNIYSIQVWGKGIGCVGVDLKLMIVFIY